jgi:sorbitol-specific phosphotransferase system component IIBC
MRTVDDAMKHLIQFVLIVAWLAGIVLAKGFWSTFVAVIIPLWGYYLVVEKIVERYLM